MKDGPSTRTGTLVVRLWIEAGHETGLRARITQTADSMFTERPVAVAATADDICATIRRWVDDFAASGVPDGNGGVTLRNAED